MTRIRADQSLRLRYIIGLSAIAVLVTASYLTMQHIVSQQRGFAALINTAGHQSGLANRIAYFAGIMATTEDETEYAMARSQVGRTVNRMEAAHHVLREGDAEQGIPQVTNERIATIYDDPMVGLDSAVQRYIERARAVYDKSMAELSTSSGPYIFLTTYGPHVLEPMFDAAVEEYEAVARAAIVQVERMERRIWVATLATLLLEAFLIFVPLERRIRNAVAALQSERNFLQHVIDGVADPIIVAGRDKGVLQANAAGRRYLAANPRFGPSDEVEGRPGDRSVWSCEREPGEALDTVFTTAQSVNIVRKMRDADGQRVTEEVSLNPVKDDNDRVTAVVSVHRDLTRHHELMAELEQSKNNYAHLAHHDALTGLPNRTLFNDRLRRAVSESRRHKRKLAVLFLDLDGFKLVNDSYDHSFGDEVLQQVAERMRGLMRDEDTLARMGGDEFTIILQDIDHVDVPGIVASKILAALEAPYQVRGKTVFLSASVGIGIFPQHGDAADDLVRSADTAMYRAKDEGRNTFRYYSKGMTLRAFQRITLETRLRRAIEAGDFVLHYQPQINLRDNRVSGLEALVRWQSADQGLLAPAEFIQAAEESGLIVELGEWVLLEACRQMRQWMTRGILAPDTLISVNISGRQFDRQNLVATVQKALASTGLPAANLELEITESTMMRSAELTQHILRELLAIGVKVAIDDFGTGYSSLSHLKLLPLTKLKIDKSFVSDIPADANDMAISKAIISLGKSLSLEVLAEGVETREQLAFLVDEGCDTAQGYLFSRPVCGGEIEHWLGREEFAAALQQVASSGG